MVETDTEVPPGWTCCILDDVCNIMAGNPAPQGSEFFKGGKWPFVRVRDMGCLDNKWYLNDTIDKINDFAVARISPKLFPSGSVLFTKSGMSALLNQRAILPKPMYVVSHIGVGIPTGAVTSQWLFLSMYRMDFKPLAGATTLPSVRLERIKRMPFLLPPINEQYRIVSEIERQFTRLDAGVKTLKRTKANLKRYRASALKAACEGRLVPQDPNDEPAENLLARILKEQRCKWEKQELSRIQVNGKEPKNDTWLKKFHEPMKMDTTILPKLPAGWVWATIEQVGNVQLGRQRSPEHHFGRNMRPYLRAANVFEASIDTTDIKQMNFTPEEYERFSLKSGDILLNEGQTPELVGRPAIYRDEVPGACFQNTLVRFQCRPGLIQEYALATFRWYLHSLRFKRIAQITTNIAHLGLERFVKIEFPLPPYEEQKRIVKELNRRFALIEELDSYLQKNLQCANRLRQSILKYAFSGKLVAQDPCDESASVLLEKIRNERANLQAELRPSKVTPLGGATRRPLKRRETN